MIVRSPEGGNSWGSKRPIFSIKMPDDPENQDPLFLQQHQQSSVKTLFKRI
jgi:hypothetical protein